MIFNAQEKLGALICVQVVGMASSSLSILPLHLFPAGLRLHPASSPRLVSQCVGCQAMDVGLCTVPAAQQSVRVLQQYLKSGLSHFGAKYCERSRS